MVAELSPAALLRERPSGRQRRALEVATRLAGATRTPLCLVGGAIRDLLLTGQLEDLDLVVEGDSRLFASELADRLGAEMRVYDRFLTAEILTPGLRLDITTARREEYPEPARLPLVERGSLQDDLARRDFSVNAMAIRLWPEDESPLIDPFGGRQDLERRVLRVLHDRSFVDDPTRVLRGVRLAARLAFRLERHTEELALAAIDSGAFEPLSGDRLRRELTLLWEEKTVVPALRHLVDLGLLTLLHPSIAPSGATFERIAAVTRVQSEWRARGEGRPAPRWWLIRLMALLWENESSARAAAATRLDLEGETKRLLVEFPAAIAAAIEALQRPALEPHEADAILRGLALEQVALLLTAPAPAITEWVARWLDEIRRVRLELSGEDLLAQGFRPGPAIGRALAATLAARLDGQIDAHQELGFAVRCLREENERAPRR